MLQNIWHWKNIDTGCYRVHTAGSIKIQGGTEYITWKHKDTGWYIVHTTGSIKIQGVTEYIPLEHKDTECYRECIPLEA